MEHKFGIFSTVEELNRAAAARKAEGDLEALTALALENGLDREDAEDYMEGAVECLCTPAMAAIGKLNREAAELDLQSQLGDWKDYVIQLVMESRGGGAVQGRLFPGQESGRRDGSRIEKSISEQDKGIPGHHQKSRTAGECGIYRYVRA